ncbi:MAG: DUF805 domain-containing protein [Alphaproteobacteria bacterium]
MRYAFGCLTVRYAAFDGRARRLEYWTFCLLSVLLGFAAGGVDGWISPARYPTDIGMVSLIYLLLMIIPSISVTVRRLHDTDHSGWCYLLGFIPVIGWLWLFVLMLLPGTHGPNDYGDDPISHTTPRQEVLNALGRTV